MTEKITLRKSNSDEVPSHCTKKVKSYPKINIGTTPKVVISKSGKVITF